MCTPTVCPRLRKTLVRHASRFQIKVSGCLCILNIVGSGICQTFAIHELRTVYKIFSSCCLFPLSFETYIYTRLASKRLNSSWSRFGASLDSLINVQGYGDLSIMPLELNKSFGNGFSFNVLGFYFAVARLGVLKHCLSILESCYRRRHF